MLNAPEVLIKMKVPEFMGTYLVRVEDFLPDL